MKLAIGSAQFGLDYGVSNNEFTFDYVISKVDEVYSTFPNTEIDELLTKIKQYNNG